MDSIDFRAQIQGKFMFRDFIFFKSLAQLFNIDLKITIKYISIDFWGKKLITVGISGSMYWVGEALSSLYTLQLRSTIGKWAMRGWSKPTDLT